MEGSQHVDARLADSLTPEQRRRCMQANKAKDTSIEVLLRKELFKRGRRYRIHVSQLPGRPDIVFPRLKVAVFVDGDFWHGFRLPEWQHKLSDYWVQKINRNRKRDARNHRKLRSMGWKVIRIWEHELRGHVSETADRVEAALNSREKALSS